jgi:hypothetical protein
MVLRTLNYHKVKSQISRSRPMIVSDSLRTLSTGTTDHHEFYQDARAISINPEKEKPIVTCCSSLYQQIDEVFIEVPDQTDDWKSL